MAPTRASGRKSSSTTSVSDTKSQLAQFPVPPRLLPTKTGSPKGSPRISPSKRRNGITQGQLQFLMDNLQAEITNRARELRAEANTRVQRLRSNIELRIYQIPSAMRKATLGDVLAKCMEQSSTTTTTTSRKPLNMANTAAPLPKIRSGKRNSTYILEDEPSDTQNDATGSKRPRLQGAKMATSAAAKRLADARILSPRSHNSRTLPLSPVKGMSPLKSGITRPFSPAKPAPLTAPAASTTSLVKTSDKPKTKTTSRAGIKAASKTATASTASMRAKRAPASKADSSDGRRQSNESSATTNSTGTTIVTKKRTGTTRGVNKTVAESKIVGIPAAGKRVKAAPAAPASKTTGTAGTGRKLRTRP